MEFNPLNSIHSDILYDFLNGTNYLLIYSALIGNFKKIFSDTEFLWYLSFILILLSLHHLVFIILLIYNKQDLNTQKFLENLNLVLGMFFQIVAIITTTGFVTSVLLDGHLFNHIIFGLMFLGASSGSTSGGIKISRHSILIKNGFLEFKKSLHPNAVLPLRYNHNVVKKEVVINILGFFMLYLLLFIIGAGVLSSQGLDFVSNIGGSNCFNWKCWTCSRFSWTCVYLY